MPSEKVAKLAGSVGTTPASPASPANSPSRSNGSALDAIADEAAALFTRRIIRLEQVSILLRNLYREHAQCLIAEKQNKADTYLHSDARSHGEREGQASAHSISLTTETLLLKGEITALEEERDFLKFCIEQDGGA